MTKGQYINHYRKSLQKYFADTTEEGRIAKYYANEEIKYALENVFGMSKEEVSKIYDEELRAKYGYGII